MSQITIKHLAQRLNLSVSTVSRALNDSYEISEATRNKVKEMAQALNYKPNLYALNLRSKKSRTIAVIVPEVNNSFFALAIDGIEEIAQQNEYHVLVYLSHDDHVKEAAMVQHLLNGRVEGILMSVASETNDTSHIDEFRKNNIPVVFFDRIADQYNTMKVVTDDYNSGYRATTHLIENGCKNIAYLSVSKNLSIDQKRMNGFLKACSERQVKHRVVDCSQLDAANEQILTSLLKSADVPDGIFASVEKLAISTYEVCNNLNLIIPDQLKVISFSNLKIASLLKPSLSTITQPAFEIGKRATEALFGALKNDAPFQDSEQIVVPSTLIGRESTRKSV